MGNKNTFSFELSWFEKEGLFYMVAREWAKDFGGHSSVERWQNKIRHLRQFLRGWARNESGIYKQEKDRLIRMIKALDLKVESNMLHATEQAAKTEAEQ